MRVRTAIFVLAALVAVPASAKNQAKPVSPAVASGKIESDAVLRERARQQQDAMMERHRKSAHSAMNGICRGC